ncbi:MAG: FAD-dependent oxidoreductase [Methanobrevibacter sp.]|jgi:thioredoxin reductase (NADPH)|nr:FAD-dependent oxidoreductase [Candidatus Methanovirga basalitermitum]
MESYDIIIVGAGPAGLTAGIYTGRQGSKSLILEKTIAGGLGLEIPSMGNYPGFELISGMILMSKMKQQAQKFLEIKENESAENIIKVENGFEITTTKTKYFAKAIILTMGRKHRKIGVTGEEKFLGLGVSYCATCDGIFYKDKKTIVIGGGNSSLQEAIFLDNLGVDVTIVHRREEFRAEHYLQEKIKNKNIKIIPSSNIKEIKGDKFVKSVILEDKKGNQREIKTDGVFVAIGSLPSSIELTKNLNIKLDDANQIVTDKKQETSMLFVYSAGDITGGLQQLVVACGEGAIAATSAYNDLENIK